MDNFHTSTDQLDEDDLRALESARLSRDHARYHIMLLALGLAFALYRGFTGASALPWYYAGGFASLIGLLLAYLGLRRDNNHVDVEAWRQQLLVFAGAAGALWGSMSWVILDLSVPGDLALLTLLTCLAAVAGVFALTSLLAAQVVYALAVLAPLLARLVTSDLKLALATVAAGVAAYIVIRGTSPAGGIFEERNSFKIELRNLSKRFAGELLRADTADTERLSVIQERDAIRQQMSLLKREAEQAALTKDEFLATMSHEIRTPLNGILPLLDLMRRTQLSKEQKAHMSTILASSRHLLGIIDSMLDYSKMQAGKLELEQVGFNLSHLLDSVTKLLGGSASRKNVALEAEIETNVRISMRGDPVRLRQVLTNLISNAVKFTENGSVNVTVSAVKETVTEYRLLFSITDTGIGIDEATQKRLFQPFTQADASVTRNFGGSGLGLVICRQIIELMGGEIGVRSEPGEGSEFWFEIPMLKAVGDIAPEARRLAGTRMLVVTGDDVFGKRASRFAQTSGCNVSVAGTVQKALALVKRGQQDGGRRKIHVLAVDQQSTGAPGLVLAKKLASHPQVNLPCLIFNEDGDVPRQLADVSPVEAIKSQCAAKDLAETIARLAPEQRPSREEIAPYSAIAEEPTEEAPIKARVLLVEDNHINLSVASNLMNSLGLEFETAENGYVALEMMAAGKFDAVLMDCMMPIMDGYTAARRWREVEAKEGRKRLPIIAMTANAMSGDMEKCLDAGMDAYVSKPLDRSLIAEHLRRFLGLAPTDSDAGESEAGSKARVSSELDERVLKGLTKVMGSRVQGLIRSYIKESPELAERMRHSLHNRAYEELASTAHELKSTSASLGVVGVGSLCQTIELAARKRSQESASKALGQLTQALGRASRALSSIRIAA
ncbi:MAG: ATP-binding protein [Pseudomonadota bacterium]